MWSRSIWWTPTATCSGAAGRRIAELFRLAIGGYGLFGVIIYAVTLRLMPAHRVRRVVEITSIERLESLFKQRIADGFTYGDFQYRTDETSPGFLRDGVMSCYIPVPGDEPLTNENSHSIC